MIAILKDFMHDWIGSCASNFVHFRSAQSVRIVERLSVDACFNHTMKRSV